MWGARQGAKAYLTKPVQESDLMATIQQFMN
jgi:CheY-like chemotaxis protein